MRTALTVLVTLVVVLPLLGMGAAALLQPAWMLDTLDLSPDGVVGLSTVRADIGGLLLATGVVSGLALVRPTGTYGWVAAGLMGSLVLGRLVGLGLDGTHPDLAGPLAFEVGMLGLLLAHAWLNRGALSRG
jgi:hypothetical protein